MQDKAPSGAGARQTAGPFAALHFRDFRLFWIGLFVSNIGTWMQMTAISWLLYDLTNSPVQLGLNGVFRAIPAIGLGLFGGAMADRYDRKRLMLITQVISMLLAFVLGFLAQTALIQVWHIYALTCVSAIVGTLDGPARQALYPSLVPASVLPNTIALKSLLWKGTALLGPSLAGIAISTVGTDGAVLVRQGSPRTALSSPVRPERSESKSKGGPASLVTNRLLQYLAERVRPSHLGLRRNSFQSHVPSSW